VNIAYLKGLQSDPAAGLAEMDTCLSEWLNAGFRYFLPIIWIAQVRIQLLFDNKMEEALETVKVAFAHVAETGEATLIAELYRLSGVIALASNGG
jgi:predicted ATPase